MVGRIYLNNDWFFSESFEDPMKDIGYVTDSMTRVRIPHTVKETPLHYFDEHEYQMISGYIRTLEVLKEWKGKVLLLTFEGVAHCCEVYVNGEFVGEHRCGYTAFTTDISDAVRYGEENIITVKVDSRESLNQPPFGFVIDYMTFGGIYRDVYISVSERAYIDDSFVYSEIRRGTG